MNERCSCCGTTASEQDAYGLELIKHNDKLYCEGCISEVQ